MSGRTLVILLFKAAWEKYSGEKYEFRYWKSCHKWFTGIGPALSSHNGLQDWWFFYFEGIKWPVLHKNTVPMYIYSQLLMLSRAKGLNTRFSLLSLVLWYDIALYDEHTRAGWNTQWLSVRRAGPNIAINVFYSRQCSNILLLRQN